MGLPLALSRGQYLALAATGARSVDAVLSLGTETLTRCVGDAAAKAIGAIEEGRVSA
ncbi:hypothetical protein [Bradyrhizobium sp. CCBAU 51745]|uniref:hypothetical protein n=1 Tax=Bradyrhizobium sp. CCBAU 51745 TaxID=1325099 RepID=UPI002306864E|nr:hypothetical protein [Bradyrhizobium sp. CCBAU 51745]